MKRSDIFEDAVLAIPLGLGINLMRPLLDSGDGVRGFFTKHQFIVWQLPVSWDIFPVDFENNPVCKLCNYALLPSKTRNTDFLEHIYHYHHFETVMKANISSYRGVGETECPLCHACFENSSDRCRHYAIFHKRVLGVYRREIVYLNTRYKNMLSYQSRHRHPSMHEAPF